MTDIPGKPIDPDKPDLRFICAIDQATPFEMTFDLFEVELTDKGPAPGDHLVHGSINWKGEMLWDTFTAPVTFKGPNDIEQWAGCFHTIRRQASESILNWTGEKFLIT